MGGDSSVLRPEHPSARSLGELVNDFSLETIGQVDSVEVSGVSINTGNLRPGDLYVGAQGANSHGASYAAKARAQRTRGGGSVPGARPRPRSMRPG